MAAQSVLKFWVNGDSIPFEEAENLMDLMLEGAISDGLIGALLTAHLIKGPTGPELAGLASGMRKRALTLSHPPEGLVDTCGTGGGQPTFNLSTAAAIVASAAGAKVAKHGNRGVTSACGSADVLELLGLHLVSDPAKLDQILQQVGLVFLFAPNHHGAMKAVMPVRRSLGLRTVFNLLGPLSNPAGAKRQLIGVYEEAFLQPVAEALSILGADRTLVVHSAIPVLDEVSPCGPTRVLVVEGHSIQELALTPEDFGLKPLDPRHLEPETTIQGNATLLQEAIGDPKSSRCKAILPNCACALFAAGVASSLKEGVSLAVEAISTGKAVDKLNQLVEASR